MQTPLHLFAKISPKADHFGDAKNAILGILRATREEEGCYRFDVFEGSGNDVCLYLFEEWRDDDALSDHYAKDYTKAVFENYQNWLAKPVEIHKFYSVDKV